MTIFCIKCFDNEFEKFGLYRQLNTNGQFVQQKDAAKCSALCY